MTQAGPLQWRTGAGWLILLGGGRWEDNEMIHSQAISAITDESPIAFIPAADPDPTRGEAFLSFYADLGAPHGYVVPIHDQQSANRSGQLSPSGECESDLHRRRQSAAVVGGGGRHARDRCDWRRHSMAVRSSLAKAPVRCCWANGASILNRQDLSRLGLGVRCVDRAALHRGTDGAGARCLAALSGSDRAGHSRRSGVGAWPRR